MSDTSPDTVGQDAPAATTDVSLDLTIAGEAVPGAGTLVTVEDPSTERVLAEIPGADLAQVDRAVAAASAAFDGWAALAARERSAAMHRLAEALERRRTAFVDVIVAEAGTPVALCEVLQVDAPLRHLRWYAEAALRDRTEDLGVDETAPRSASLIGHRPAGVVAALSAYNYPLLLAVSKVGAALAAGCTVVLAPSPLAPLSTLMLGEAAREAGLPAGVLNVVVGGPEESRALTRDPRVAKVSFTGSAEVGAAVMRQAADAVTGVVLELGGQSPNLLLPGTDVRALCEPTHLRYLRNAGQGCASPTRILVPHDEMDRFVEASRQVFADVPVGDPRRRETVVGPVITAAHRDRVASFVDDAVADGAEVLAQGRVPGGPGYWSVPTLLGDVPVESRARREEIFGPVGVLVGYGSVEEAVAIANETSYGLAANVYARDVQEAIDLAPRLRAGLVTVNGGGALRPDGVFGGFGISGIGREHGEWGIREFLEPQHVQWAIA